MIEHVRMRRRGADAGADAFAKSEVFEIEPDIDSEARAVGPDVVGAPRDGKVVETLMRGQGAEVAGFGHAGSLQVGHHVPQGQQETCRSPASNLVARHSAGQAAGLSTPAR